MNLYPYNPNIGNRIQTGIKGVNVDRGFIAHLVIPDPAAADSDGILAGQATSATGETVVDEFLAQPDVARQISITPGGTTASVAAGNIIVEGLDAGGNVISEDVAILATANTAVFTTKAFAKITGVTFPQQDGAGATFDVGVTDKLGIPYKLSLNTVWSVYLNGAEEGTAPTVTTNADDATKNLIDLNSSLNGTQVDIFLIV